MTKLGLAVISRQNNYSQIVPLSHVPIYIIYYQVCDSASVIGTICTFSNPYGDTATRCDNVIHIVL